MHVSIAFFIIFLLSCNLISALPQSDEPSQGTSGESLDDIIQLMVRKSPTHLMGEDRTIRVHKGSVIQGWSQYLNLKYPTKNILIYHDQRSTYEGINAVQRTVEFSSDNNTGEHTYKILLFDSGSFTLAGGDGYNNWAFCGNWSQSGSSVKFYPLADLSGSSSSGRSPAKLGGGYIPENPEDTASLNIRGPPNSPVGSSWSSPEYDPSADTTTYFYQDAQDLEGVQEAAITLEGVEGEAGLEVLGASAAAGPEAVVGVLIILAVVAIVATFFSQLASIINLTHRNAHERAFTKSTAMMHASADPTKNVIVFHNQDSTTSFSGWHHIHYELDLHAFKMTVGYEIYSFDYGNFTLAGDGGYENWAFSGNYAFEEGSSFVNFYPRKGGACTPALKPRDDSGKQLRIRQPIPPLVPTRENPETKDGYYFVNCEKPDNTMSLGIAYYENMEPGTNIGQLPDHFVEVYSNHAGVKAWHGEGHADFGAMGTLFQWNFMHLAWVDDTPTVGIASTEFEQFWVYKDVGGLLFNTTANWACSSLSYAF